MKRIKSVREHTQYMRQRRYEVVDDVLRRLPAPVQKDGMNTSIVQRSQLRWILAEGSILGYVDPIASAARCQDVGVAGVSSKFFMMGDNA